MTGPAPTLSVRARYAGPSLDEARASTNASVVIVVVAVVVVTIPIMIMIIGRVERDRERARLARDQRLETEAPLDQLEDRGGVEVFVRDARALEPLGDQQGRNAGARAPLVGALGGAPVPRER